MPTTIAAEPRVANGSRAAGRLRAEERIPGVIYGHGMEPITVSVNRRELRIALSGAAGSNTVLDLNVAGTVHSAVIKEMQRHRVRHNVTHIDFQVVRMDEQITVDVPIVLHGEAKAVVSEGGLVDPSIDTLPVVTTPRNIPTEIAVDISAMQLGDVIRVADLALPAGVTTSADPEMAVVTVLVTRAAVAAEGEAAEGGEASAEG